MRIGVDLGGTKIEAVALERDGRVLARRRVATPAGDYAATLAAVRELVAGIEAATGRPGTVGVGMPGALSPATGLVSETVGGTLGGGFTVTETAYPARRIDAILCLS